MTAVFTFCSPSPWLSRQRKAPPGTTEHCAAGRLGTSFPWMPCGDCPGSLCSALCPFLRWMLHQWVAKSSLGHRAALCSPSRHRGNREAARLGPTADFGSLTPVGSLIFLPLIFLPLILLSVLPSLLCHSATQPFSGPQLNCLLRLYVAVHLYVQTQDAYGSHPSVVALAPASVRPSPTWRGNSRSSGGCSGLNCSCLCVRVHS